MIATPAKKTNRTSLMRLTSSSSVMISCLLIIIVCLVTECHCDDHTDHRNIRSSFISERHLQDEEEEEPVATYTFPYQRHTPSLQQTTDENEHEDDNSIIGGVDALPGEFPYYVRFEGPVLCGGSLIAPNKVLTAAHCVTTKFGAPPAVYVAPTTRSNGQYIPVECAVAHPDYESPILTVLNDVAILKLKHSAAVLVDRDGNNSSNSNVTKAQLVQLNSDPDFPGNADSKDLTVAGFGLTSNGGSASATLKKVDTTFVPVDQCQASYRDFIIRPRAHICADVLNRGDCQGDSGGPLVTRNGGVQVGVVSFGYGGCAAPDYPDVYARVSTYYDWIQSHLVDDDGMTECPILADPDGSGQSQSGSGFGTLWSFLGLFAGAFKDRLVNFFFFWRN